MARAACSGLHGGRSGQRRGGRGRVHGRIFFICILGVAGSLFRASLARLRQAVDSQRVALHAPAAHHGASHRRNTGVVAKRLTRKYIADVQFDQRHACALDGIVQRHAGVGI